VLLLVIVYFLLLYIYYQPEALALPVDTDDGICLTIDEQTILKESIQRQQHEHEHDMNSTNVHMCQSDSTVQYVATAKKLDALLNAIRESEI
jgi:hypothetical protein